MQVDRKLNFFFPINGYIFQCWNSLLAIWIYCSNCMRAAYFSGNKVFPEWNVNLVTGTGRHWHRYMFEVLLPHVASRIFESFGELWAMLSRDAPGEARPSAFISLSRWVSMKHRLGERLVSGCKASKLVPAWSSFSVLFCWMFF